MRTAPLVSGQQYIYGVCFPAKASMKCTWLRALASSSTGWSDSLVMLRPTRWQQRASQTVSWRCSLTLCRQPRASAVMPKLMSSKRKDSCYGDAMVIFVSQLGYEFLIKYAHSMRNM